LQADDPLAARDYTRKLVVHGRDRTYLVHVPGQYDARQPSPVVLAFHGLGSNAAQMVNFCGLSNKADEAGFIVVYPNGSLRVRNWLAWSAGTRFDDAQEQNIDDVEFVRQLLDDLARVATVDRDRVFATGMSNGAMLAYLLASELSDRIAAIAPVAGPMGTPECHPQRAVPVMHFHGLDDKFSPFQGGRGERSLTQTDFFSVAHSTDCWIKANGCRAEPVVVELPVQFDDGTSVARKTWGGGQNGAEVVLFEIAGAGHTWPGRKESPFSLEKSTRNISANDAMWEFFQRHPRKPRLTIESPAD
jgi:polyhydroxybutyrate depolymerase